MTVLLFRLAVPEDIDGIMDMVKRIIQCPGTVWDEEYPTRPYFEESLGYGGLYVAEDNGRIIATAGIQPAEDIFADLDCWSEAEKPCEGCRLGIDPGYQGKHLAIPFQRFCLNDAAERFGYDSFRFTVAKSNTRAVHVYDRFGYTRVGETRWIDIDWFCYECGLPLKECGLC